MSPERTHYPNFQVGSPGSDVRRFETNLPYSKIRENSNRVNIGGFRIPIRNSQVVSREIVAQAADRNYPAEVSQRKSLNEGLFQRESELQELARTQSGVRCSVRGADCLVMEQVKWSTANEGQNCGSPLACNPWIRGTPVKRSDVHLKHVAYQSNAQCLPFTVLSNHITPPSKLRRFTKNPFEADLINRLHLSTISPTVFAKVSSPMQQSPGFKWTIDELAHIQPAKIEESPIQQPYSPDPELETKAQAAIDRFFKQNQIIPSPWDIKQKENKPLLPVDTPNRLLNDLNSTQELSKSTKDAWSQTVLSLPLDLPENVEEVLKPFFTFTQEQNTDSDDINSSNNSLRRKLFFCHDEGTDNDNENSVSLSPIKMSESMMLSGSPPESGMFIHGTPLKRLLQTRRRSNASSIVISENLSTPNMSPIHNAENNRLYERIECCSRSTIRSVNSTIDVSIDDIERKSQNLINDYHSLDISNRECETYDVKRTADNGKSMNNDKTHDSIDMEELPKCINLIDNTVHSSAIVFRDKEQNEISSKIPPASFIRESHKRSNIISGAFDQQSISNLVQDTGYQTHSMNSTMHTIDSYNTSTNHKTFWNEKIVTSKDNTQLSWKENIRNVFSSTPSKYNKESGS